MKNMIGYCGLDCEKCDAYLATINDDQALREKTAKLFCEQMCKIRKCALEKGVSTCGGCPELETCPTVGAILENNPSALENLKRIEYIE